MGEERGLWLDQAVQLGWVEGLGYRDVLVDARGRGLECDGGFIGLVNLKCGRNSDSWNLYRIGEGGMCV